MSSPYPGAAFPGASRGTPSSGSSAERTARLVAAVVTVLALVGVLLVAVITSDKPGTLSGLGDTGQQNVPGGLDGSGGSGGGDSGVGPAVSASAAVPTLQTSAYPTSGTSTGPDFPSSASVPSSSTSTEPSTPTAAQIRKTFPVPPGTTPISKYDFLKPDPGDLWYLTTTSIAATNSFYVAKFKAGGWITYISPSVTRSNGKPTGYFYIYHLNSKVTTDLGMDANYLGKTPGKVLIRVTVSDD